jgi:hypothetical protein
MTKLVLISLFTVAMATLAFAASAMPSPTPEELGGGWVILDQTAAL